MENHRSQSFKESWDRNVVALFKPNASEAELPSDNLPNGPLFGAGVAFILLYMIVLPLILVAIAMLFVQGNLTASQEAFIEVLVQVGAGVLFIAIVVIALPIKRLFPSWKSVKFSGSTIVMYTVAMVVLGSLANLLLMSLGVEGDSENQEIVSTMVSGFPLLMGLAVVVLAPIVEEILFRYFIFGFFRRYNRWIAYLISSVAFGAIHILGDIANNWMFLLPYSLMGLVLAVSYDATKRIGYPILIHAANNGFSYAMMIMFLLLERFA